MSKIRLLLLTALMVLPLCRGMAQGCPSGSTSCSVYVQLSDSYTYGTGSWNYSSSSLQIYQGTVLRGTATLTSSQVSAEIEIPICSNDSLRVVVNHGSSTYYLQFCNFVVLNGNFDTIVAGNLNPYGTNETIATAIAACASCGRPSRVRSTESTSTSVSLAWGTTGASVYEVAYGVQGFDPSAPCRIYTVNSDTTAIVTGLSSDTTYHFYVRSVCGTDYGHWSQPAKVCPGLYMMPVTGTDTLHTSHFRISDDGGVTSNYSNGCDAYLVILPLSSDSAVHIVGNINSESNTWSATGCSDYLEVFDGIGTSGDLLGTYCGTNRAIDTFASTYALTLHFYSNTSTTYEGFDIIASCVAPTTCFPPKNFHLTGSTMNSVSMAWNDPHGAYNYEVIYGPAGTNVMAYGRSVNTSDTALTIGGLSEDTTYTFYIRSICGGDYSATTVPFTACPGVYEMLATGSDTLTSCGRYICDHAGVAGDYGTACNSTLVLYPTDEDSTIRITGFMHGDGTNSDYVQFFDGVGTTSPSLGVFWMTDSIDVLSTVGAMTIYFYSNYGTAGEGYLLHATCERKQTCLLPIDMAATDRHGTSANISWGYNAMADAPQGFRLTVYDSITGAMVYTAQVSGATMNHMVGGLSPLTSYRADVRTLCGDSDSSAVASIYFSTTCLSGGEITIGTDASNAYNYQMPIYCSTNSSISEQIFYETELLGIDTIYGIAFKYNADVTNNRKVSIYLKPTTTNAFLTSGYTSTGYVPLDSTNCVLADTNVALHRDWNVFTFATPYLYTGGNLLVAVYDNTGVSGSSIQWAGDKAEANRSVYFSNYSGSAIDIADPTSLYGNVNTTRSMTRFITACHLDGCIAPNATVDSVSQTQVSVSWLPGFNETSWRVEYKAEGATAWTVADSTTLHHSTITGLTANTPYAIRVTSLCAGEAFTLLNVRTECDAISALPFLQDFENFTAGSSMGGSTEPCWNRICTNQYTFYPYVGTNSSPYSGSKVLSYASNSINYIVMPRTTVPIDTIVVSFAMKIDYGSGATELVVGVMSDPTDITTLTPMDTVVFDGQQGQWKNYEVSLAGYTGNGQYIALGPTLTSSTYFYIDDLALNYMDPCPKPTEPTLVTVSAYGAEISWTAESDSYLVEYGPYGFAQETGTVVAATTNNAVLTGLNPATRYAYYVRGICGSDTSQYSFIAEFTTGCAPISLPYTNNFSAVPNSTTPLCWTVQGYSYYNIVQDYTTVYTPKVDAYTNHLSDGSGALKFSANHNLDNSHCLMATLPELNESIDISNTILSFALTRTSEYYLSDGDEGIIVGVCDTLGSYTSFTAVDTFYAYYNTWNIHTVDLSSYQGDGRYLAMVLYCNSSSTGDFYTYTTVDDIQWIMGTTCSMVDSLRRISVTPTTATLAWTVNDTAANYLVEYLPESGTFGTGLTAVATTVPYTLTGLNSGTHYKFRVRALCGAGDSSAWSAVTGYFITPQQPGTLPYDYDFETAPEWQNYQMCDNSHIVNWARGTAAHSTGQYAMYISPDGGATAGSIGGLHALVYRDFDFGTADTNIVLRFDANVGGHPIGYGTSCFDGLYVFLQDTSEDLTLSYELHMTPWGNSDSIPSIDLIRLNNGWHTYTYTLEHVSGVKRIAFYYQDIYTTSGYEQFVGERAQIDNIFVDYEHCTIPTDLVVNGVTSNTANLAWTGEASSYSVYYTAEGVTGRADVAVDTVHLTGLTPGTEYSFYVIGRCSATDSSLVSATANFTTLCYDEAISLYPYTENFDTRLVCWDQEPVVGNAAWTLNNGSAATGDTAYNGLSNVHFASNGAATRLISPMLNLSGLDTALLTFQHLMPANGTAIDSLLVCYRTYEATSWQTLATYTAAVSDWTLRTVTLPNTTEEYRIAFVAYGNGGNGVDIDAVTVNGIGACLAPTITIDSVGAEEAVLSWTGLTDTYEMALRQPGQPWPDSVAVTGNGITLGALQPETDYQLRLRQVCSSTSTSEWTVVAFTTLSLPCATPEGLTLQHVTFSTADFTWTPGGDEQRWVLHVFHSADEHFDTVTATSATVSGLVSGFSYSAEVKALCGSYEYGSDWSASITFATETCAPVSQVSVTNITAASAQVSWTSNGSPIAWQVEYGAADFAQGTGTTEQVETEGLELTGLYPQYEYDLYVRSVCDDNLFSAWSEKASFTTLAETGIAETEGMQVAVYPNPANGKVTLACSADEWNYTIVDGQGRILQSVMGQHAADRPVVVLPAGIYFVQIYTSDGTQVRKLVVK